MAMATETSAMGGDESSVSPYLLRRLRSHHEALRDRLRRQRPRKSEGEFAEAGEAGDGRAAKECKR